MDLETSSQSHRTTTLWHAISYFHKNVERLLQRASIIYSDSARTQKAKLVQHTDGFMHVNSMLVISVKYLVISVNMCSYAPIYIKLGPSILDPTITPLLIYSLSHLN
jgi:hypothetical protein